MSTTRATTSAKPSGVNKSRANPALQAKLRERIENESLFRVSLDMQIGREALSRYITGLPMHTSTVRGIEATLGHLPEASKSGLRR